MFLQCSKPIADPNLVDSSELLYAMVLSEDSCPPQTWEHGDQMGSTMKVVGLRVIDHQFPMDHFDFF